MGMRASPITGKNWIIEGHDSRVSEWRPIVFKKLRYGGFWQIGEPDDPRIVRRTYRDAARNSVKIAADISDSSEDVVLRIRNVATGDFIMAAVL